MAARRLPGHRFLLGGEGWEGKRLPRNVAGVGRVCTRDRNAFNATPRAVQRDPLGSRPARLDFRVDLLRLFQGPTNVDMAALPSVKFDRADAARLGRNFADLIKIAESQ